MYAPQQITDPIKVALRAELLRLAVLEDRRACETAATVPYWAPTPPEVAGHRTAARLLRESADSFLAA